MKFLTLPKALYTYPDIKKILFDNQSCILFKKLNENLLKQEKMATSHCFIFVLKGCVEVQTPKGNSIMTQADEILFMPRDTYLISDFVIDDGSIEMYLIFVDHDIVNSFLASKINRDEKYNAESIVCKLNSNRHIKQYFNAITNVYFDFENNKELLKIKILEFLLLIDTNNQEDIVKTLYASEKHKKNRNITTLMLDNYDKNLTVSDFANLSGRSLSSFNRDFKRKYDMPPKQWLTEKRMHKAAKLLSNGSNVTNCAIDVGYSNVSHFIKAYKTVYGKTPREMKNLHL